MLGLWFLIALMARSSASRPSMHAVSADTVPVEVRTFQYRPQRVEVKAGTVVEWRNEDQIEHTATADSATNGILFHLPLAQQGARNAFTFERPGTYAYQCARHPFMRGEIHVALKADAR